MASKPEFDIMHTSTKYHKANSIMQDLGRSDNNRSLSRTTSVMSIASLDLHLQEAEAKPISTLRDVLSGETSNLRLGPLVHLLLISCLLFGSLSEFMFSMKSVGEKDTKYKLKKHKSFDNENKGILGSAMISSVTEALSPILPFAGGVDLRRDNAWRSWRNYLWIFGDEGNSILENETAINGKKIPLIPRGGASSGNKGTVGSSSVMILSANVFCTL